MSVIPPQVVANTFWFSLELRPLFPPVWQNAKAGRSLLK